VEPQPFVSRHRCRRNFIVSNPDGNLVGFATSAGS
jgi:hypothetical protein